MARKRSEAIEVPKYLKITEIDMKRDTFKKVFIQPKVITELQMNETIQNGR